MRTHLDDATKQRQQCLWNLHKHPKWPNAARNKGRLAGRHAAQRWSTASGTRHPKQSRWQSSACWRIANGFAKTDRQRKNYCAATGLICLIALKMRRKQRLFLTRTRSRFANNTQVPSALASVELVPDATKRHYARHSSRHISRRLAQVSQRKQTAAHARLHAGVAPGIRHHAAS